MFDFKVGEMSKLRHGFHRKDLIITKFQKYEPGLVFVIEGQVDRQTNEFSYLPECGMDNKNI